MNSLLAPTVSLRDVSYRWPSQATDTLRIRALDIFPKERVLLCGESGCGKSTLLSLIAGILVPTAGTIGLLGQPWHTLSASRRDAHRADHIGYIFQQFNLLGYLSVQDNVLLPCHFSRSRAKRAGPTKVAIQDQANQLLLRLQIDRSLWHRPAGELSVGQQQRVAAARALMGSPELVVADEPTSALDAARRVAFMDLLVDVCDWAGSALLFVSHDRSLSNHFSRVIEFDSLQDASLKRGESA
jgi:putative ABC transport system ATP-binding protein